MILDLPDALSFFRLSCGRWWSQRSSHHLLHRRAEAGASLVLVEEIDRKDKRLIHVAELHQQNPEHLVGGCYVRWSGSMSWDQTGEEHEGETVFGLIPTDTGGRSGLLLRDRGYAETSPVTGEFCMDEGNGLVLITSYETMQSFERFWFAGPNTRLRVSTVEGLSNTASFCMESRLTPDERVNASASLISETTLGAVLSPLGW